MYLSVYCKNPYCDFEEFLEQVKKFEELKGCDFEEYWDLIYSEGFSPEVAVKWDDDFFEEDIDIDEIIKRCEEDEMFERWAAEETDYSNYDRIDEYYAEDED